MKNELGDKIEFVSYDGHSPALCCGRLIVKINDKEYCFSNKEGDYLPFWYSSGSAYIEWGDVIVEDGEWVLSTLSEKSYPDVVNNNLDNLIELFNSNVQRGCCGGCV